MSRKLCQMKLISISFEYFNYKKARILLMRTDSFKSSNILYSIAKICWTPAKKSAIANAFLTIVIFLEIFADPL